MYYFLADFCKFFRRFSQKHFSQFVTFRDYQRFLSAFISEKYFFKALVCYILFIILKSYKYVRIN